MTPDPGRSLPQKALDTIAVFDDDQFTMEDFLYSARLLGVMDFSDI